tara:strand:- start:319 stop:600 length:282 start_codon:yes stop_codon:yes gene_type:complete
VFYSCKLYLVKLFQTGVHSNSKPSLQRFTIIFVYQIVVMPSQKILELNFIQAGVTQWLEYLPSKQKVAGSNPVSRSNIGQDTPAQLTIISGSI